MDAIRERVVNVISEISSIPAAEVDRVNAFTELGKWDSLLVLNMVLGLEREFNVQFDIADISSIQTLPGVVELVRQKTV